MSAFEGNGEGMSVHNDVCGSVTLYGEGNCMVLPTNESRSSGWISYNSMCSETSKICLSFSCCYENESPLACHLVSSQKGAWHRAFFFRKVTFFNLKRRSELQKKTPEGGVLKSTQDFFENTVYSISLTTSEFVLPLNFSWLLYSVWYSKPAPRLSLAPHQPSNQRTSGGLRAVS